jgi:uncharacterized protein YcfJ
MRRSIIAATIAAIAIPAVAAADPPPWAPAHGRRAHDEARLYDSRGYYAEPRRISEDERVWRGGDGRYHCRRANGTTGLVIGAALGAAVGHEVAGRGDRTLGTILGAAGGGLLGREIDRGSLRCR